MDRFLKDNGMDVGPESASYQKHLLYENWGEEICGGKVSPNCVYIMSRHRCRHIHGKKMFDKLQMGTAYIHRHMENKCVYLLPCVEKQIYEAAPIL